MDTLTHGLLGAALAALPLPGRLGSGGTKPVRAALVASVLAAELPDLDYLLPAKDAVLHALSAHRGYSHSLLAAPLVALAAALLAKALYREAALAVLYVRALIAVPLAHLLPDLWTGWGTRLFLPFSERRMALDWTMVLDPVFTAPLLLAALWALLWRRQFRRAMAVGAAAAALYVALRVVASTYLTREVAGAYPDAASVHVFPAPLGVLRFRYIARFRSEYAVGSITLGKPPLESARHVAVTTGALSQPLRQVPTVREALSWARFPIVKSETVGAVQRVSIADLRYHLAGAPTLTFVVDVARDGSVERARLERGGSAGELFRRLQQSR